MALDGQTMLASRTVYHTICRSVYNNSLAMAQFAACIVESRLAYKPDKLKDLCCSICRDLGKPVDPNSIRSTRFME